MTWILDLGGILAGLAALLAALLARGQAKKAVNQTNGALQAPLKLIIDGQRSLGHQVGEIRKDMGRMDERLTDEVAELRRSLNSPP